MVRWTWLAVVLVGCGGAPSDKQLEGRIEQLERRVLKLESARARGRSKVQGGRTDPRSRRHLRPDRAAATGTAMVEGDALRVFLLSGNRRLPIPGRVPPGDYAIRALFDLDGDIVPAGDATLTDGEVLTVVCDKATSTCTAR